MSRLDTKLAKIRSGKYAKGDFIIADAKDGDMSNPIPGTGPIRNRDGSIARFRTRAEFLEQMTQIIKQDLSDTLIVTVADKKAIDALRAKGVRVGDPFDLAIGGLADESAGEPVRVVGEVVSVSGGIGRAAARGGQLWVAVKFGRNNIVVLSPFLTQITDPEPIRDLGINPDDFKVIAIKSRVHFRRGFDDNRYAKTILIVEPTQGFLGTVHLENLPYQHVDLKKYYPYGRPTFP